MKGIHHAIEGFLSPSLTDSRFVFFLKQLVHFGYLQSISCIFPVMIFVALAATSKLNLPIARYDLLLLLCIAGQYVMYKTGMETRDEVYVITLFHLLGLFLELHKVRVGSWSYPGEAYTKFAGVPLYAGFMYASVGSYLCQAWRNLTIEAEGWPRPIYCIICGLLVYSNFFTNAFFQDLRWPITVCIFVVFWRAHFAFTVGHYRYKISAILSFALIGFFIWLAENFATFFGAWKYAYQHAGWKMVTWHKITSWSLLVIVSIIIVAELKRYKQRLTNREGRKNVT